MSSEYGLTSDPQNMLDARITLMNGSTLWASTSPDILWALRGGGNNFGVVTKFNVNAFPLGNMWGGARLYSPDSFSEALDAIYNFAGNSASDLDAANILVSHTLCQQVYT